MTCDSHIDFGYKIIIKNHTNTCINDKTIFPTLCTSNKNIFSTHQKKNEEHKKSKGAKKREKIMMNKKTKMARTMKKRRKQQ